MTSSWSPRIVLGRDAEEVAVLATDAIVRALQEATTARGVASLVLAGGTTPRRVHALLAERGDVPWSALRVFVGDERAVPMTSADANARMVRETLLDRGHLPRENVALVDGGAADLEAEAVRYAALLPAEVDLLLLGMGEDAHTASLFPRATSLDETQRRFVVVHDSPKPPPTRLSVTPAVLASARTTFLFATGASKAPALADALSRWAPRDLPIQLTSRPTLFVDALALPVSPTKESP